MKKLTREEEIILFKKVNSAKKVVTNPHTNFYGGNSPRDGYFNQGVSKAKLREYIEKEGLDYGSWK